MAKKPLDWGTREGVNMSTIKKRKLYMSVSDFLLRVYLLRAPALQWMNFAKVKPELKLTNLL